MNNYKKDNFFKEGIENRNCKTCGFQIKYDESGVSQIKSKKRDCLMKGNIAWLHEEILGLGENDENLKPKVALAVDIEFFATRKFEELQEDHKCLLDVFFDPESYKEKSLPKLISMNEVNFINVQTTEELQAMSDKLTNCTEIAVNLEYYLKRSYLGFTWLLKISTEETYYMINCLKLQKELHILNPIFMDIGISKIFHDGEDAVLRLYKDFGIFVTNMFDTAILTKILAESKETNSLQKTIGFEPSRIHTHFLIFFKTYLVNSCINSKKKKFLKIMRQSCEKICRKVHHKVNWNKIDYKKLIDDGASSREHYVSTELLKWRDEVAKQLDECPNSILPDNDISTVVLEIFDGDSTTLNNCYRSRFLNNREFSHFNIHEVRTQAMKEKNTKHNLQCLSNETNPQPIEVKSNSGDFEDEDRNRRIVKNKGRKQQSLKRVPQFK